MPPGSFLARRHRGANGCVHLLRRCPQLGTVVRLSLTAAGVFPGPPGFAQDGRPPTGRDPMNPARPPG